MYSDYSGVTKNFGPLTRLVRGPYYIFLRKSSITETKDVLNIKYNIVILIELTATIFEYLTTRIATNQVHSTKLLPSQH